MSAAAILRSRAAALREEARFVTGLRRARLVSKRTVDTGAREATFPRIVRFLGTVDAGPDAKCPHCGAGGRYIVQFVVEGGKRGGAMRGCAKLIRVVDGTSRVTAAGADAFDNATLPAARREES